MTLPELAQSFGFGCLAMFALTATWRREGARHVGAALLCLWIAATATFLALPPVWYPGIFSILYTLLAAVAALAWLETGARAPMWVIRLSIMAVCACWAFSWSGGQTYDQLFAFAASIDVVFVLQCIIVGTWGLAGDNGRPHHLDHRAARLRHYPQSLRNP